MPRIVNKPPEAEPTPEYLLTVKLLNEFREKWTEQFKESGVSATLFSRLSIVALTQVAAIVGVDVGMTQEQFVAVCQANFNQAFEQAPKFG